jgi:hypothetical protein
MKVRHASLASFLLVQAAISVPASAQVTAYTNEGAFSSATSGTTTYSFPITAEGLSLGTSYTWGPATFSSDVLFAENDAYGVPYLADGVGFGSPTLSVTTSESAIGFYFGSYYGAQTITYDAGGLIGTLDVPAPNSTTFIGFTGLTGPTTLTFTNNAELDTTEIVAAFNASSLPEPSTWALMLLGFGAIGASMRHSRRSFFHFACR